MYITFNEELHIETNGNYLTVVEVAVMLEGLLSFLVIAMNSSQDGTLLVMIKNYSRTSMA